MRNWVQPALFLALVAAGAAAIHLGWLDVLADQQTFRHQLLAGNPWTVLGVSLAAVLYTGLGAPRQLLALASGLALGPFWGTLYSAAVTLAGAVGCFYSARWLLRPTLRQRAARQLASFDRLVQDSPMQKILMIRLLPVGSNLLTNLFAGSSRMPIGAFLGGSLIGYLPQTLVFALIGAGVSGANTLPLAMAIVMFVLAAILSAGLYRNHKNRQLVQTISLHTATNDSQ